MKIRKYRKTETFTKERKMYEISGVYNVKFYPDGSVSRMKKAFKMVVNTEQGVMAFYDEQRPFESIAIKNPDTKADLTEYFLGVK